MTHICSWAWQVVRREGEAVHGLRTYVHVGTGNYNPNTAAVYTDFGLLSCDPAVCNDVNDVFKLLTGTHRLRLSPLRLSPLMLSPLMPLCTCLK